MATLLTYPEACRTFASSWVVEELAEETLVIVDVAAGVSTEEPIAVPTGARPVVVGVVPEGIDDPSATTGDGRDGLYS